MTSDATPTIPASLEEQKSNSGPRFKLSLFWRTFLLLALLLAACVLIWLQALWAFSPPGSGANANPDSSHTSWIVVALVLSLGATVLMARLINNPLKPLLLASTRLRDGDFDSTWLDEQVSTSEIREVNIGFNRMAEQIAEIEQDRAVMLAGISHDMRTPLARLRLEAEMSVPDEQARAHIAADILQLDGIIGKFLDYARPSTSKLVTLTLKVLVDEAVADIERYPNMKVNVSVAERLQVLGDEVDLSRVIANLLENAHRYGRTPQTGIATIDILAQERDDAIVLKVRDHGPGVSEQTLTHLTKPFFRGDSARTSATGSGLGLSIVEKTVARMGGTFFVSNVPGGGLLATIRLKKSGLAS